MALFTPGQQIAADFATLLQINPASVTYDGHAITATMGLRSDQRSFSEDGQAAQIDFVLRVPKATGDTAGLATSQGQKITIGGTDYRIIGVGLDPFGTWYRLAIGSVLQ